MHASVFPEHRGQEETGIDILAAALGIFKRKRGIDTLRKPVRTSAVLHVCVTGRASLLPSAYVADSREHKDR